MRIGHWNCAWQAVNVEHLKFLFEGRRVMSHNTPSELGLEADDVIDAVQEQVCLSCSWCCRRIGVFKHGLVEHCARESALCLVNLLHTSPCPCSPSARPL